MKRDVNVQGPAVNHSHNSIYRLNLRYPTGHEIFFGFVGWLLCIHRQIVRALDAKLYMSKPLLENVTAQITIL